MVEVERIDYDDAVDFVVPKVVGWPMLAAAVGRDPPVVADGDTMSLVDRSVFDIAAVMWYYLIQHVLEHWQMPLADVAVPLLWHAVGP